MSNSLRGQRIHQLTSRGRLRALTALLLLGPGTPMLFQGQEFCASSPFLYFADHGGELADHVRRGRAEFLSQFPSIASPEAGAWLADPASPATFERSKLDRGQGEDQRAAWALHHDLIALRRSDPTFRQQRHRGVDGAVLGPEAFVLRFFGEDGADRLVLVNLGGDLELTVAPEPLLAPPAGRRWDLLWSSENPAYGGGGGPVLETTWVLPAHAAIVLHPTLTSGRRAAEVRGGSLARRQT